MRSRRSRPTICSAAVKAGEHTAQKRPSAVSHASLRKQTLAFLFGPLTDRSHFIARELHLSMHERIGGYGHCSFFTLLADRPQTRFSHSRAIASPLGEVQFSTSVVDVAD